MYTCPGDCSFVLRKSTRTLLTLDYRQPDASHRMGHDLAGRFVTYRRL